MYEESSLHSDLKEEINAYSNKFNILKKLEENKDEMKSQNAQIEKMQKKIREIIGPEATNKIKINVPPGVGNSTATNYGSFADEILNGAGNVHVKNTVTVKNQTQPKTGIKFKI
jgi:hypothetical protein